MNNNRGAKKLAMSLQEAIELGEYDPVFLSQYPEWQSLSHHVQFEYIRKGLDNRRKQLLTHWAELTNVLEFSKKPKVQEAVKKVEQQVADLLKEKERLYVEYST
jgi:hypothetical protein